jgi:hypothetical protein
LDSVSGDITAALRIDTMGENRIRLTCAICGDVAMVTLACYPAVQRKLNQFRDKHTGTCSKTSGAVDRVRTDHVRSVA